MSRYNVLMMMPCTRRTLLRGLGGGLVGTVLGDLGARGASPAGGQVRPPSALFSATGASRGLWAASRLPSGPALLVYDTAQGLLAGDLQHAVTRERVQHDLSAYDPDWSAVGVGTTNQIGRTGELILDGTTGSLRFWWADPSSASQADVTDLGQTSTSGQIAFPFMALGVGRAPGPLTWAVENVADVHFWLKDRLASADIPLAAVRLEGSFGPVMTTVSYNIPSTGIDTSAGYVGSQYFRFVNYPSGFWSLDGVYAAAGALQPVISTAGNPLHLHGYQPGPMLGGHIVSAAAVRAIATVWLLDQVIVWPAPLTPEATG